jgi:hypothetical protein
LRSVLLIYVGASRGGTVRLFERGFLIIIGDGGVQEVIWIEIRRLQAQRYPTFFDVQDNGFDPVTLSEALERCSRVTVLVIRKLKANGDEYMSETTNTRLLTSDLWQRPLSFEPTTWINSP